jgi:ATP-dependent Clp protease ATP-binding subunit ClpB
MFVHGCSLIVRNLYSNSIRFNTRLFPLSHKIIPVQNRQFSNKTSVIAQEVLRNLQKELDSRVIGQSHATKAIVDALHLHAAGLGDSRLPITNLLFLGPTGVGKTELAKVLAEIVYGNREALLQFDMSKYTHAASVSGLVGTTQGFVGYSDGGLLTQPIIQNPDRIILFDELEKAHFSIYKVLLSVMGSGEIADNRGKIALFNRSIIVLTSNLCSLKIQNLFSENFSPEQIEERLRSSFMEHFSPDSIA